MTRLVLASVLLVAIFPLVAFASVHINEVAWMGSVGDANAEWIELYNSGGEPAALDGWTLRAADGQPTIMLSGTLSGNSYLLLERGEGKDYTGALGNDGEMLELVDANGAVVDQVDGSDAWSIGGNNETKDTLSRIGTSFGTAKPTPGAANASETKVEITETQESVSDTDEGKDASPKTSSGKSLILKSDDDDDEDPAPKIKFVPRLSATAGGDRIVTVGTATTFSAHAYEGDGDEVLNANFVWNFGDGAIERGRLVEHSYAYPGDYVVGLTVTREEFREAVKATDRITVHARSAGVVVTDATSEFIRLENSEAHELDLSGVVLA